MNLPTKPLLSALDALAPIAAGRKALPILQCFMLSARDGCLNIHASDLDQYAECSVECSGDHLPPLCVSASLLRKLVGYAGEGVEIRCEGDALVIVGGGTTKLRTLSSDEFPEWPKDLKMKALGINCADLAEAIERVEWASAEDIGLPWHETIHVAITPTSLTAQASNGKQAAVFSKAVVGVESTFLVHRNFAPRLIDALRSDGAVFSVGERYLRVESNSGSYWCKMPENTFPVTNLAKWTNQIRESTPIGTIKSEGWTEPLRACASLCDAIDPTPAKVLCSPESACITFESKRRDSYTAALPGEYVASAEQHIYPHQWLTALRHFKDCPIALSETDSALVCRNGDLTAAFVKVRFK